MAGLVEQRQGFSVFGGYEAGDLVDVVLTPAGPVLVGAWARVGDTLYLLAGPDEKTQTLWRADVTALTAGA